MLEDTALQTLVRDPHGQAGAERLECGGFQHRCSAIPAFLHRGLPPPRTLHDSVVPGTGVLSRRGKAIAPTAHDSSAATGNQRG